MLIVGLDEIFWLTIFIDPWCDNDLIIWLLEEYCSVSAIGDVWVIPHEDNEDVDDADRVGDNNVLPIDAFRPSSV